MNLRSKRMNEMTIEKLVNLLELGTDKVIGIRVKWSSSDITVKNANTGSVKTYSGVYTGGLSGEDHRKLLSYFI